MADVNSDNYYKILGVSKSADDKVIKKAYHKMAVKYHPDKNKAENAATIFKKINEAYSVLSDKNKRASYDRFGKTGIENGVGGNPGFNMSQQQAHDIFSQFFGTGGPGSHTDPLQTLFSQMGNRRQTNVQFGQRFTRRTTRFTTRTTKFTIPRGRHVLIHGLNKKDLNGEIGVVSEYFEPKKRYIINAKGTKFFLKEENLQQIHNVEVFGLEKNTTLNGKKAKIVGYDKASKRYQVLIDSQPLALKAENVLFSTGSMVKLASLKSEARLNHMWVKVIQHEPHAEKYVVKTEQGRVLRVKCVNVFGA